MTSSPIYRFKPSRVQTLCILMLITILGSWHFFTILQTSEEPDDNAWIIATKLSGPLSPTIKIRDVTSDELSEIPVVVDAIEEVFQEEQTQNLGYKHSNRLISITKRDAKAIIKHFNGEFTEDKNYYEYYIRFVEVYYSILIRFERPPIVS